MSAALPPLRTHAGISANPFADIAAVSTHRRVARLLALAVIVAHDDAQVFAVLRGFARANDEPAGVLTGWLSGCHLTHPGGASTIDRGVLDLYARVYLGESLDVGAVAWLLANHPRVCGQIAGAA